MESFGAFETTREISSAQGAVIYGARKTGEAGADTCAVKVFSLDPLVGIDQPTRSDLDPLLLELSRSFTNRIDLQKKAAAVSEHIAPILDSGKDYRGVWYATRFYPRSVQKVIAGRVALSKEGFFHIIDSILKGALAVKRACGRGHGNLKPANALISAAAKLREAEVVLTDPLPGNETEAARYEVADLRAIGEIIYQLVRRRQMSDSAGWLILPIEASREWTELFGKDADAWRTICNRLLDPNLAAASYTLEQLEQNLAPLAPKPPVSREALLVAAGVVVVGLAGIILFVLFGNRASVRITSDPPGAAVTINGQPKGTAPLHLKLAKGSYELAAQAGGLEKKTATLVIQSGKAVTHHFDFDYGGVVVSTEPVGASVKVGGVEVGRTPFTTNFVKPGTAFEFQLDLEDHDTANLKTTVKAGKQPAPLHAVLTKRGVDDVMVEFESNLPLGEKIILNGNLLSNLAVERQQKKSMPPGNYTVTATFRNWRPITTNLVVRKGERAGLHFDFPFGRVALNSDPPGATVSVGTAEVGVTPTNIIWQPGAATFTFLRRGYEPTNMNATVSVDGGRLSLEAKLAPILGFVEVTSDPTPATIYDASGKSLAVTPSEKPIALQPDTYTLTARYPGLPDVARQVTVEKGRTVRVDFPFRYGRVRLASDPPNAEVFDPLRTNWVPVEAIAILPEGTHSLTARHTRLGLPDEIDEVIVARASPRSHLFNFRYGSVTITSLPPNALVLENGAAVGQTPLNNRIVKFGKVTYSLSLSNRTVTVSADIFSRTNCVLGANFIRPLIETWTNGIGMPFVLIPKSPEYPEGGYWVGMYEVTQEEYEKITGANPSGSKAPRQPVDTLSWKEAMEFCTQIGAKDKTRLPEGAARYSLPTEKQWAYFVADAKLEDSVTSKSGKRGKPEVVGSTGRANRLGLYDVRGNVADLLAIRTRHAHALLRFSHLRRSDHFHRLGDLARVLHALDLVADLFGARHNP
jgi:hypothetical protein